jgi:formylglycine-generating enzyme required for sulfatase activity
MNRNLYYFSISLLITTLFCISCSNNSKADVITIRGTVLCDRATSVIPWHNESGETAAAHTPVIFAVEGTPEIVMTLNEIVNQFFQPDGLNAEQAQMFLDKYSEKLKFYITGQDSLVKEIHKLVEYPSLFLSLTGMTFEKDGKKWIKVINYQKLFIDTLAGHDRADPGEKTDEILNFPEKMLQRDKPFVQIKGEPLELKVTDKLSLKCILIPSGSFLMGSAFYERRYQDEFPHKVTLTRSFYMAEIPVTQEMFKAITSKNPSTNKGSNYPVENASYKDILHFCQVLSAKNGLKVRLPTDAEWEYAARVGTSNPCFKVKYIDQISNAGSDKDPQPVKSRQPNAWGLYDMLCCGWHLMSDWKEFNSRSAQVNPIGVSKDDKYIQDDSIFGKMHRTKGGYHYKLIHPPMHGAAAENGTIWEGGRLIFRVVVEQSSW